jgi:hypothetical protein
VFCKGDVGAASRDREWISLLRRVDPDKSILRREDSSLSRLPRRVRGRYDVK